MDSIKLNLEKLEDVIKILEKQKYWSAIIYYDRNSNFRIVDKLNCNESNTIDIERVDIFQSRVTDYSKDIITDIEDYKTMLYVMSRDNAQYKVINSKSSFRDILFKVVYPKRLEFSSTEELEEFKDFLYVNGFFEQDVVEYIPEWYYTVFKSKKGSEILYPLEIKGVLQSRNYNIIIGILKYLMDETDNVSI